MRSGVGCQMSSTASQTSSAKSISVKQNVSGEYSNCHSVSAVQRRIRRTAGRRDRPARSSRRGRDRTPPRGISARWRCKDAGSCAGAAQAVEGATNQFLAGLVSTWIATSSGTRPPSIRSRTKSKSVREAGKRDFDLFETHADQQLEEAELAFAVHRFDQRLVAVAQIRTAPDRRGQGFARATAGPATGWAGRDGIFGWRRRSSGKFSLKTGGGC